MALIMALSYRINIFKGLKVGEMLLDTVNVCVVRVRNYTTASVFPFFTASGFERTRFSGNFKANNGYSLANFR